jgi:hypothetical protein
MDPFSNELDHQVIVFPEILIRQSFEKGESGWLTRQKSIDSLWIHSKLHHFTKPIVRNHKN